MRVFNIGVLAFHGDVEEHVRATEAGARKAHVPIIIERVRTKAELGGLDALIIPGGESTTLQKLCDREGMFPEMRKVRNIFGTCAGAILLAKKVHNKAKDQRTLGLMDIEVARNSYGRQNESFEKDIKTEIGKINATFIRAPRIKKVGAGVTIIAKDGEEIVGCEERIGGRYYLALSFHPELTTNKFHEYFLRQI